MAAICKQAGIATGRRSGAADFGPVLNAAANVLRTLFWSLPPASAPSEFRTHGGRLR